MTRALAAGATSVASSVSVCAMAGSPVKSSTSTINADIIPNHFLFIWVFLLLSLMVLFLNCGYSWYNA
jgi:hypothetical protein